MALIFLSVLLAIYIWPISCSVSLQIMFQSLKAEHLPPEESIWMPRFWCNYCYIRTCVYKTFHENIPVFNFGLCSFIEVCQKIHFTVSPEFFVLSSIAVLSLRVVWFFTIGIKFFNCSWKEFLPEWQERTEPNLSWETVRSPSGSTLTAKAKDYLVCLLLLYMC